MSEWIIVRMDDHRPHLIGSNQSPFRTYADGSDPNASGEAWDGPVRLTYLPVVNQEYPQEVNEVLQKVVATQTTGDNGIVYPGAYSDDQWVMGWELLPQDIDVSRQRKLAQLNADRDARVAQGYELDAGTFPVPLTEDMGKTLAYEADQYEKAVAAGAVSALSKIQFFGANGDAIEIGVESLREHSTAFYLLRKQLNADFMNANRAIESAETPELVDAVSWQF